MGFFSLAGSMPVLYEKLMIRPGVDMVKFRQRTESAFADPLKRGTSEVWLVRLRQDESAFAKAAAR